MAERTQGEKGGEEEGRERHTGQGRDTEGDGAEASEVVEETEDKRKYWTYKNAGICTRCKLVDTDFKKDGRRYALCPGCREVSKKEKADWKARNLEEWKSQIRRRSRKVRERLKDEGMCARCRKREATNTTTCDPCAIEFRDYCNGRRKRKRLLKCTLCKGKLGPPHRMRTACPLRFKVSIDEFATSRPGSDHPDSAMSMDTNTGKWFRRQKERKKKEHVNRSEQFSGDREGVGDCGGSRSEVGSHPEG